VSLTLRDGKVLFRVGYGGETRLEMASQDRHNTGNWTIVEASRLFDRRKKLEKGVLVKYYLVTRNSFTLYNFFFCQMPQSGPCHHHFRFNIIYLS
jgi:hypothetical protein